MSVSFFNDSLTNPIDGSEFEGFFNATANSSAFNISGDLTMSTSMIITTAITTTTTTVRPTSKPVAPVISVSNPFRDFSHYVNLVVVPIVCIIAMLGNITSVILISRDGLKKASNVLLIALAIADTCLSSGRLYANLLMTTTNRRLRMNFQSSYALFILNAIFGIYGANMGLILSATYVMLITTERLIAVFFPLKFHQIVTPLRALVGVVALAIFFSPYAIIVAMCTDLSSPIRIRGDSFRVLRSSIFYRRYRKQIVIAQNIINEYTGSFAIAVIIIGSLVIGYKVKLAAIRRARMMQNNAGKADKMSKTSRTTKTLLAVSVTFVTISLIVYTYDMVLEHVTIPYDIRRYSAPLKDLLLVMNSGSNFFIYVFSNERFRDQLLAILCYKGNVASRIKARGAIRASYFKDSTKKPS